jgi:uncharacterized membrane protein YcaP (DUF421 family)
MFTMGSPAWGIAVRTIVVYVAVFAGLRLMGKRELGQMTVFDLVVILLIANAVQNAMVGPDASLQGGLLAAFVLLVGNRGLASAGARFGRWGRLIEGTPTILVQDGRYVEPSMRKEEVEPEEVEMAIREHGLDSLQSVRLAVLEVDGSISIVPSDARVLRSKKHVRQLKKP